MIKTLFVGLFYSTIIPSSLFITSFAMLVTYVVDRYCLLRMWSRPPMYDEELAVASRKMMMVCVWVHIIMARIFFSNWPYKEEICEPRCDLFACYEVVVPERCAFLPDQKYVVNVYTTVGILIFIFGFFTIIGKTF